LYLKIWVYKWLAETIVFYNDSIENKLLVFEWVGDVWFENDGIG
jgi:hypothetical protein